MSFIGDIHNDYLINFTRSSIQLFDYNFVNYNVITDQGFNFGIDVIESNND